MAKRKTQWHPRLAELLRYRVERYYELRTNVPVGDLPRLADILLLRRTAAEEPPFPGMWRYLRTWNVLEYKGPTVAARREHLALLVEVGLGIARRLNAERSRERERPIPERDISFWYLANQLGRTFRRAAVNRLGRVEEVGNGIWQSTVLGHPVLLVSVVNLPLDDDSLPLHVLGDESMEQQIAVGQFVIETAERFDAYGSEFASFHEAAWEEVMKMAKSKRGGLEFTLRPIVKTMGMRKVIDKLGRKEVINEIGAKGVVDEIGIDAFLAGLSPAQRRELERRIAAESERKSS